MAGIASAIALLLYLFLFDTYVVPTDDAVLVASVAPTLSGDDRLLVQRGSSPRYGQLARCASPEYPGKFVIGRIFGVVNDTVEIKQERVTVSGQFVVSRRGCKPQTLVHPITGEERQLVCSLEENGAWTYEVLTDPEHPEGDRVAKVEADKAFLVSDNRHIHYDSRDFGPVDLATCEHVVFRLWGTSFGDSSRRFNILW